MKKKGDTAWQMIVLGLLAAAMVVSLMIPESLLTPAGPKRVEISILLRQGDSAVWATARQGMEQAAEDLGAELRFLTLEAEEGADQVELLRRQADMGVDAAVVIPADCAALEQQLDGWQALPVVTLESRVEGARAFVPGDARCPVRCCSGMPFPAARARPGGWKAPKPRWKRRAMRPGCVRSSPLSSWSRRTRCSASSR